MVNIPLLCISVVCIGLAVIIKELNQNKEKNKNKPRPTRNNYYRYEIRDLENEISILRKFHSTPKDYDYRYWVEVLKSNEETLEKLKQNQK